MAFIFFREKVRPFPHLAKPMNTFLRKVGKAMVQMKRDWFDTALENYERGEMYGRWKEKICIFRKNCASVPEERSAILL